MPKIDPKIVKLRPEAGSDPCSPFSYKESFEIKDWPLPVREVPNPLTPGTKKVRFSRKRYIKHLDVSPSEVISDAAETLVSVFQRAKIPEDVARKVLSDIADRAFPPPPPLPEKPPALWSDDSARQYSTPRDFLEATYAKWLKTELTWPYLYKNDLPLYNAVRYQLKKAGIDHNDYLPSKSALVQRDLERAGPAGIRAATRLHRASQRRN